MHYLQSAILVILVVVKFPRFYRSRKVAPINPPTYGIVKRGNQSTVILSVTNIVLRVLPKISQGIQTYYCPQLHRAFVYDRCPFKKFRGINAYDYLY